MEGAIKQNDDQFALTAGRNIPHSVGLYPYTSIPRSSPSERILRVILSTGIPLERISIPFFHLYIYKYYRYNNIQ